MKYMNEELGEPDKSAPQCPKLLIEVMSAYNYDIPGEEELNKKLEHAFANGTEAVWIVHTGVLKSDKGVEVLTTKNRERESKPKLLKGDEELSEGMSEIFRRKILAKSFFE
jgi:Uma2 family endonuclease